MIVLFHVVVTKFVTIGGGGGGIVLISPSIVTVESEVPPKGCCSNGAGGGGSSISWVTVDSFDNPFSVRIVLLLLLLLSLPRALQLDWLTFPNSRNGEVVLANPDDEVDDAPLDTISVIK